MKQERTRLFSALLYLAPAFEAICNDYRPDPWSYSKNCVVSSPVATRSLDFLLTDFTTTQGDEKIQDSNSGVVVQLPQIYGIASSLIYTHQSLWHFWSSKRLQTKEQEAAEKRARPCSCTTKSFRSISNNEHEPCGNVAKPLARLLHVLGARQSN